MICISFLESSRCHSNILFCDSVVGRCNLGLVNNVFRFTVLVIIGHSLGLLQLQLSEFGGVVVGFDKM